MHFLRIYLFACSLLLLNDSLVGGEFIQQSAKLPNILCVTSEDNAAHWLGCYGNTDAQTPTLDVLANRSILFTNAYSNAPVCAVARSTLLNGAYAVTTGTQHMRSRYAIPSLFKPYVSYLQDAGYYCTNNRKTDYNRKGKDTDIWDECSNKAHYKNRNPGQPFFAIFNFTVCHESSLFPEKVAANRQKGIIPQQTRLTPDSIKLPPYLPDLPEVRSDFAIYHDNVTALDNLVAKVLKELASAGLDDDTIIFYFSDHGGPTPRGKRYLHDTGVKVPMIVHFPEKWRHLSPFKPGERTNELVSFVDLAPTFLSLVDQAKPAQMQGRAFLGKKRVAPPENPVVFLFADRFDEILGMRRGVTDGRFKYIRRFTPHLPAAPYSYYSLGLPSWTAWQKAWQKKQLKPAFAKIWEHPQQVEELYDLSSDPWEVHNLADDPAQAGRLEEYRNRLGQEIIATNDTSLIPESMFSQLADSKTIYDYANSDRFNVEQIQQIAFAASAADPVHLPFLSTSLEHEDPIIRYWAALGCAILEQHAAKLQPQLIQLLDNSYPALRITAALALSKIGSLEASKKTLLAELDQVSNDETAILLINTLKHLGYESEVPDLWLETVLSDNSRNEYLRRFAKRQTELRGLK